MKNKQKLYLLDTNIVICLAVYDKFKSIDKFMRYNNTRDRSVAEKIEKLYREINKGTVRVAVTPTVVSEFEDNLTINYFKNSPISVYEIKNKNQISMSVKLAEIFLNKQDKFGETIFSSHENLRGAKKRHGINDAYIAAEAQILGKDLVTFDKHFLKQTERIFRETKLFYNQNIANTKLQNEFSPRITRARIGDPKMVFSDLRKAPSNDFSRK